MLNGNSVGIYVHVPYCRVVCPYCDFVKRGAKNGVPEEFVTALCREIEAYEGPSEAASVFFGGGTPSMMAPEALERVLEALDRRFRLEQPEISLETNPDDATATAVADWKQVGVTRLSLGVQSFEDEALRYLGRIHDGAGARQACERVAGTFAVWGMDLIFGAGTRAGWTASLTECRRFDPPHVSMYALTFEENTPFWKRRAEAIEEDESLALYREGMAALGAYRHYEVSNFAKAGYECAHNRVYWRNEEYAGFGPGAYSFLGGIRSRNVANITQYIGEPLRNKEELALSEREIKVETLIQHFRTRRGLDRAYYAERFGGPVEADFGDALGALVDRGLLEEDDAGYRPSRLGYELNDEIGLTLV